MQKSLGNTIQHIPLWCVIYYSTCYNDHKWYALFYGNHMIWLSNFWLIIIWFKWYNKCNQGDVNETNATTTLWMLNLKVSFRFIRGLNCSQYLILTRQECCWVIHLGQCVDPHKSASYEYKVDIMYTCIWYVIQIPYLWDSVRCVLPCAETRQWQNQTVWKETIFWVVSFWIQFALWCHTNDITMGRYVSQ